MPQTDTSCLRFISFSVLSLPRVWKSSGEKDAFNLEIKLSPLGCFKLPVFKYLHSLRALGLCILSFANECELECL